MTHLNKITAVGLVLLLTACSQPDEESSTDADGLTADTAAEALKDIESELEQVEAELAKAEAEITAAADETAQEVSKELEKMGEEVQASADELVKQIEEHVDPGKAYLHINAQKPNVKVTESGLQFEILKSGDGESPGPTSRVVTHYQGSFIDGRVFDSSIERGEPAEFPVNRVIKGWTEALQMMKEGDKWRLVIPSELAYGKRGAGGGRIPPDSVLVFEVELIQVKEG